MTKKISPGCPTTMSGRAVTAQGAQVPETRTLEFARAPAPRSPKRKAQTPRTHRVHMGVELAEGADAHVLGGEAEGGSADVISRYVTTPGLEEMRVARRVRPVARS